MVNFKEYTVTYVHNGICKKGKNEGRAFQIVQFCESEMTDDGQFAHTLFIWEEDGRFHLGDTVEAIIDGARSSGGGGFSRLIAFNS